MSKRNRKWSTKEIWFFVIIFFDISYQLFRYGGMALYDQAVHAVLLCMATVLLITGRRRRKIPLLVLLPLVILFGTVFIQLVPLPDLFLKLLSPSKFEILQHVSALAPTAEISGMMTLIPQYHTVRMSAWLLDALFFMLLFSGPRPSRLMLFVWVAATSIILSSFSLIQVTKGIPEDMLTWVGLPGNNNQFSGVLILLTSYLLGVVFSSFSKWHGADRGNTSALPMASVAIVSICMNIMAMIQMDSRSGLLIFFMLFLIIPIWFLMLKKAKWVVACSLLLTGSILVFFMITPSKNLTNKINLNGLSDSSRFAFNERGMSLIKQVNVFGTGLGSSAGLLGFKNDTNSVHRSEVTEFHNDIMQMIVEIGIPGLAFIVFLAWWFYVIWSGSHQLNHDSKKYFLYSILTGIFLLGVLSLVTFPLRITGIRLVAILLLSVGLRFVLERDKTTSMRFIVLTACFCILGFFSLNYKRWTYLNDPNPLIARAAKYGTVHHIPLFKASTALTELMIPSPLVSGREDSIAQARHITIKAIEAKPTSIRAQNILFNIDLLSDIHKLDRNLFEIYKRRANKISTFGTLVNQTTDLTKYLLFASAPHLLTSEEIHGFQDMKEKHKKK